MDEKQKNDIALFRYGVIAPLVQRQCEEEKPWTFFKSAQKKKYEYINGEIISISATTMGRWYRDYIEKGFDGLKPAARCDLGVLRKIDEDIRQKIIHYVDEYPRLPASQIYLKLLDDGDITKNDFSKTTLTRFVSSYKRKRKIYPSSLKERRRYEKEHINEVWYGDSSVGPYIRVDGIKRKTWIIALIDDASRMITGIGVFFEDNFVNLMKVMKSAVSKYGKPKIFCFDNGANYKSNQTKLLAARIGCAINYCQPYDPESKSKIKRWFRTLKDQWMSLIHSGDYTSLEELEKSLRDYVNLYNMKVHSSLEGFCPHDRFFKESDYIIRMTPEEIERSFLLEIERRVSQDNVVIIEEKEYEIDDYHYNGQRILIRYSPDLSRVYVVDKSDNSLNELKLLDKKANSHIRRNRVKLTDKEKE